MYHELGLDAQGIHHRTPWNVSVQKITSVPPPPSSRQNQQGCHFHELRGRAFERLRRPCPEADADTQGMRHTLRLMTTFFEGEEARGKQLVYLLVQPLKPESWTPNFE